MSKVKSKVNPIPLVEGIELVLGQWYLLTPAQKLVIRDWADFFPDEKIQCIDTGCEEAVVAEETPTWSPYEGWVLPGDWKYQEFIPPAFSDSGARNRHYRTVRITLDTLTQTAKHEKYVEFERRELQKLKAQVERQKNSKSKTKSKSVNVATKKAVGKTVNLTLI